MQDYEKLGVFYLGREVDAANQALKNEHVLFDSKDLTAHALCVGGEGSGATGLSFVFLEEAAIDGIPSICIDSTGELASLLLAFPSLAPTDFVHWVDAIEAQQKGLSLDRFAAEVAESWKRNLAEWEQSPERIARLKKAADVAIYTPGSESGLPLSIPSAFAPPPPKLRGGEEAVKRRISTLVSALLGLLGRETDPDKSRDHTLLSGVLEHAWQRDATLDIPGLLSAVQKPPFERVGSLDLESFYPAKERLELAMAINDLLAAPNFAAWLAGEPLDARRLLFTRQGKPRVAILSVAHLSPAEQMFVVTLVLNEMSTWMRNQSKTESLRAILYIDEIGPYFPASGNPPSKQPLRVLLEQASSIGLGCLLATRRPGEIDYAGLENVGTWLIGMLQSRDDKQRLLQGLGGLLGDAATPNCSQIQGAISNLEPRNFLLCSAGDDAPVVFKTRWTLSYLRGPLTGLQISRLMAQKKSEARRGAKAPPATMSVGVENVFRRPSVPGGVPEYFLAPRDRSETLTYKPMIMGRAKLHFQNAAIGLDRWQTMDYLAPLSDDGAEVTWQASIATPDLETQLERTPVDEASYAPLPDAAMRAESYKHWGKALAAYLSRNARTEVLVSDALGMSSIPGESEGDFRARLALKAREQRDAAVQELRRKYASKVEEIRLDEQRGPTAAEPESSQKPGPAVTLRSALVRALFGWRTPSAASAGRLPAPDTVPQEAETATDNSEAIRQRRRELQRQFDADCAAIEGMLEAASAPLRKFQVTPVESDLEVTEVALVWTPWRRSAEGQATAAFDVR